MRLLSVGSLYPPHHRGGYELAWQGATRHLRAVGHEVRVLATEHREPGASGEQDDDVHRELRWWWRDGGWPRRSLRERVAIERHNGAVLDRHLAGLRPDAVLWWAMGGMSLSLVERVRRAGLPALGLVMDDWMHYGPLEDQWLRLVARGPALAPLAERLTGGPATVDLGAAARWLFISETTRERALRSVALPDTGVAHAGVDARWLERAEPERPWRGRLLLVGRLDPRKGAAVAVEALEHLPGATLVVAPSGSGEAPPGHPRVELLEGRGRADLPAVYADADVVLFPVLWDEPWGLVPLEAMALGRPVVASGRGGSAEYLRDGENCLLAAPGDAAALAAAVRRLAADPALRERLREGGFRTAARHTDARLHAALDAELAALVAPASG